MPTNQSKTGKLLALSTLCILAQQTMGQRICNDNGQLVLKPLPYWDAQKTLPCMYSGTFPVQATGSQNHLFYWLFKNTTLASGDNTPLVLWLNGGPGASSMFGLFLENGPLQINKTGPLMSDFKVGLNPRGSWGDQADILYVDQPAGTGFSYYSTSPLSTLE